MKFALDVARKEAANGIDAISTGGAECGAISWVAMQVAIQGIISCKENGWFHCLRNAQSERFRREGKEKKALDLSDDSQEKPCK